MGLEKRKLVAFGATTNGDFRELVELCNSIDGSPCYELLAFLDDNESLHGTSVDGVPVRGSLEMAGTFPDAYFINAIGTTKTVARREQILKRTGIPHERFATFIHPRADVSQTAKLGPGCLVFSGARICSEAKLGACCDVMPNAVISHGCEIGQYTFVASGTMLGGRVTVGDACFLGLNCSVREDLSIGRGSLIGQGCVVLKNVAPNATMIGNPARELHKI